MMQVRFTRIIDMAGALCALDSVGRIWVYEPDGEVMQAWRMLPPPPDFEPEPEPSRPKGDIGPMFGDR